MCDGRPGPSSAALPLEQAHELGVRDYGAVSVAIFWISQSRFPDQPDRAIPDTDPPQGQRVIVGMPRSRAARVSRSS